MVAHQQTRVHLPPQDKEVLTLINLSKQTERDDVIDDIGNRIKSMLKGMY